MTLLITTEILCNGKGCDAGCSMSATAHSIPADRDVKTVTKFAERQGWHIKGPTHYCPKCGKAAKRRSAK